MGSLQSLELDLSRPQGWASPLARSKRAGSWKGLCCSRGALCLLNINTKDTSESAPATRPTSAGQTWNRSIRWHQAYRWQIQEHTALPGTGRQSEAGGGLNASSVQAMAVPGLGVAAGKLQLLQWRATRIGFGAEGRAPTKGSNSGTYVRTKPSTEHSRPGWSTEGDWHLSGMDPQSCGFPQQTQPPRWACKAVWGENYRV